MESAPLRSTLLCSPSFAKYTPISLRATMRLLLFDEHESQHECTAHIRNDRTAAAGRYSVNAEIDNSNTKISNKRHEGDPSRAKRIENQCTLVPTAIALPHFGRRNEHRFFRITAAVSAPIGYDAPERTPFTRG